MGVEGTSVRISDVARQLGVSADTLRFYERSGLLPRPQRTQNGYRDYGPLELDRIRMMLDLRRLDLPLDEASRLAAWCQSGHCAQTTAELPTLIAAKRVAIRERMAGLQTLDRRLAALERHVSLAALPMAEDSGACCSAAAAIGAEVLAPTAGHRPS